MNERDVIYDELSRVLTDYKNNNGDRRTIAEDLYNILVKIQRYWEDIITSKDD